MRETVKKTIDNQEYEFGQFPATGSLKILTRLAKIVGDPLGMFATAFGSDPKKNFLDQNISGDVINKAVKILVSNLDENEVIDIVKALMSQVLCEGKPIVNFDVHFQGRLGHLFKVIKACIEVQYSDFFEGSLGFLNLSRG